MRMASDYSVSLRGKCYADEMKFLCISPAGERQQPRRCQLAAARRRRISQALLAFFLLIAVVPASAAPWTVEARPTTLLNGAPVLFQVQAPVKLDSLSGSWLGHQLSFSYNATTKTWFVLAGVSLETNPGRYTLELTGQRPATQTPLTFIRTFLVARAQYPKIKVQLSVEKKFTAPTPEQQAQIAESVKVKQEYLGRVTPERKWDGDFKAPVDAATSDVFGSQRIFNGVAQRPHLGLDFRVPTGTPVAAMNGGTVLLARFLYFEGNCVVIDHGLGLLTLYFHLSEIKVKEGDSVKRGEEIGVSGGTGRATGPHLHVAVRWQGTSLDPARLLQLPLP
jgi:murein DD-endopeptidase MepM/ murein hydrolase activator NlpD